MKPRRSPLPELNPLRHDAKAAPALGPRRTFRKLPFKIIHQRFENGAVCDFPTLRTGGRSKAALQRTIKKIRIRLRRRYALHDTFQPNLTLQEGPPERCGHLRILFKLLALATEVISVKSDPSLV